jgi:hypothetical protein
MRFTFTIAIYSIMLWSVVPAFACTCRGISTQQAFDHSSAVIEGLVIDLEYRSNIIHLSFQTEMDDSTTHSDTLDKRLLLRHVQSIEPIIHQSDDPLIATVLISKSWKGSLTDTINIVTERSGISCGISFQKNKEYLIFALEMDGHLHTGLCNRTKLLNKANAERSFLKEIIKRPIQHNR